MPVRPHWKGCNEKGSSGESTPRTNKNNSIYCWDMHTIAESEGSAEAVSFKEEMMEEL
jgi:hypothetical protein